MFEAGALSKSLQKSRVCTVLFGLEPTDLKGPLTIFQHTRFQKEDFRKLVKSINLTSEDSKLEDSVFDGVFEMWWPRLEDKINLILNKGHTEGSPRHRSERDLLEEILQLARVNAKQKTHPAHIGAQALLDLYEGIVQLIRHIDLNRSTRAAKRVEKLV